MPGQPVVQDHLPDGEAGTHPLQLTGEGFRRGAEEVAQLKRQAARLFLHRWCHDQLARLPGAMKRTDIRLLPSIRPEAGESGIIRQDIGVAFDANALRPCAA